MINFIDNPGLLIDLVRQTAEHCHDTAVRKGWYERLREAPELIALCHSELSETLEAFRDGNPMSTKIPFPSAAEEMADLLIRALDMCHHLGLDVGGALVAKLQYNERRPMRHGGKVY